MRDPLAATLGQPAPDNRSKAELAEADAAMKAEIVRRRATAAAEAEVARRADQERKSTVAAANAEAAGEKINSDPAPRRLGGIQGWF
ncbi:hypothetical protein [Mesorhizobium sp. M2D.F.Ca.ET.226.01.1.1]|uniref:hypothetical protein n=1 Tax=Mesorhizobium sp. M2D.F.Ca.ET.226.01.1.1 TaxID=2496668 RepID=UPI000FD593AF|nr:hypothetical protein [Mesorhizobium sp. M2D.F.Ca.ET.226.01.1.1]TGP59545.1 hypothetical protein EN869_014840 [Mesorhizobium sp. M2D.F.Ca.ET.226.01.1.1]